MMQRPELKIIGLVGYAQTGKDEAAKALAELGWRRVSFADPVRNGLYALNPYIIWWDQHSGKKQTARLQVIVDAIGWEGAKKILEVRELLQRYGTDAGRLIHGPNCWVNIAMTYAEGKPRAIFTDVRFPNEAAAIRDRGGLLVRVERPGVGPVNGHISDTGVADIECHETWINDSDLHTWQKTVLDKYGWWVGQEKLSENLKNLVETSPSQPDSTVSA